jgi:predicted acyltransferase
MSEESTQSSVPNVVASSARIVSVDALRGFDMFWIVGADHFARALGKISESPVAQTFATQLKHVGWEGFRFYDLIFPLFVFMLGMSVVFSLPKYVAEKGKLAAHVRVVRRFVVIFLLGAVRDAGVSDLAGESPFSGVLQRMAWCYLGAALIFLNVRLKGQVAIFAAILIGYWALVCFVPHPDLGADATTFNQKENFVDWVDHKFLPMKEEGQYSESEGLLSTIPAIATALLGLFAGLIIRNNRFGDWKRVGIFIGAGVAMVALGHLWGLQFPVIKKIWTSSYVLVAGGYSCILLGVFYCIVDTLKFQRWAIPFVWIGANPLMIYMCSEFIDFHDIAERIVGGPIAESFGAYGELLITTVGILFVLYFARFLYHRKIFLRV